MTPWPEDLVSDIARRRAVIFLGSGVSKNSKNDNGKSPKTWREFLNLANKKLRKKNKSVITNLIDKGDYLTACQIIKNTMGTSQFNSIIMEEYLTPQFKPSELHKNIFKLDSRIVVTPNFDKIYETYANHKAHSSIRVQCHHDPDVADAIRRKERLVLKIHGTIDTPGQMIFTRKEYAEARNRYRQFYNILEALVLTHTFLFLGCGMNDPDIRLLLEDQFFIHSSSRPHIILLPKGELHKDEVKVIESTMNLQVLQFDSKNNYAELKLSISQLVEKVEQERTNMITTLDW